MYLLSLFALVLSARHVTGQGSGLDMDEILRSVCGSYICPRFEIDVNRSTSDYDVRVYPEVNFVKIDAPPVEKNGSFDWSVMREMFKSLRGFFAGDNALRQGINLTAPSLKLLYLEDDMAEPLLNYTAFYLPVSFSKTAPLSNQLQTITKPPFAAYVRIYYGCPEVNNLWRLNIDALRAALVNTLPNYRPSPYYYAVSYGPQSHLYCQDRRNEIWIIPEEYTDNSYSTPRRPGFPRNPNSVN